jgi:hypothetical protein
MLISRFHDDDFGLMPAFHVLGLRDSLGSYCLGMMQGFVLDLVFV